MTKVIAFILTTALTVSPILTSCDNTQSPEKIDTVQSENASVPDYGNAQSIILADGKVTVNGTDAVYGNKYGVYTANDIVYYPEGKDFTFGEGTDSDAHSEESAAKHTVVHITKPGNYILSGKLTYGQVAVDLGEDAEDNPDARVTLILNGVDINCEVAPAVIFYNVFECGSKDKETASKDVDTSDAGANVIIADGSVNNINGSYVAKIYKSYELNEDGTEVIDSKKLHKYDAAFYSKMSMNIFGGTVGDGILNIKAENEGLDSELHLTINGGNISIESGNDGINTNEDYISVTTLNGGNLNIVVNGSTGEGDGVDSNGWLVINGGTLNSSACGFSGDAGIDSDMGIHINGGEICASGNMLDRISESSATYAVFNFASRKQGGSVYTLKSENGETVGSYSPTNDFSYLIISSDSLVPGTYTLWCGDRQLAVSLTESGNNGRPGGMAGARPDMPQGERPAMPDGERPAIPQGERPEGMEDGNFPQDGRTGKGGRQDFGTAAEMSTSVVIDKGGNYFVNVTEYAAE